MWIHITIILVYSKFKFLSGFGRDRVMVWRLQCNLQILKCQLRTQLQQCCIAAYIFYSKFIEFSKFLEKYLMLEFTTCEAIIEVILFEFALARSRVVNMPCRDIDF